MSPSVLVPRAGPSFKVPGSTLAIALIPTASIRFPGDLNTVVAA
jgi:hypothetical protein